jgi:hypothetical protein
VLQLAALLQFPVPSVQVATTCARVEMPHKVAIINAGTRARIESTRGPLNTPQEGHSESPAKLTIILLDVVARHVKTRREAGPSGKSFTKPSMEKNNYGAINLEGHRWSFYLSQSLNMFGGFEPDCYLSTVELAWIVEGSANYESLICRIFSLFQLLSEISLLPLSTSSATGYLRPPWNLA